MFNTAFLFRRTRPVALHFSDHAIALLSLTQGNIVRSFAHVLLPEGIVRDGKVLDRKKLVYQVRELLNRAAPEAIDLSHEIPLLLSIPESQSLTHLLRFPKATAQEPSSRRMTETDRAQLPALIKEEASRVIPIALDELYWDWHMIDSGEEEMTALFAGTPKGVLMDYLALCDECNLVPIAIDMETQSLARVLLSGTQGAAAILDIGARTTTVGFYDESKMLNMSISIPIAGDDFNEAIIEHLHIGWEEAEALKRSEGFNTDTDQRVLVILQERVQVILRELVKAIGYFEREFKKKLTVIVLAGGSSRMPNLDQYLRVNLRRELHVGDPLSLLHKNSLKYFSSKDPLSFAPVIGLALRGLLKHPESDELNLLHGWEGEQWMERERRILAHWRRLAIPLFVASMILLGYVVYMYVYLPSVRLKEEATSRITPNISAESVSVVVPASAEGANLPVIAATSSGEFLPESTDVPEEVVIQKTVIILPTPTGWLNVRKEPDRSSPVLFQAKPGDEYPYNEENGEWVAISLSEGKTGWIFGEYTEIQ